VQARLPIFIVVEESQDSSLRLDDRVGPLFRTSKRLVHNLTC